MTMASIELPPPSIAHVSVMLEEVARAFADTSGLLVDATAGFLRANRDVLAAPGGEVAAV